MVETLVLSIFSLFDFQLYIYAYFVFCSSFYGVMCMLPAMYIFE